jgi:hypothetical protein
VTMSSSDGRACPRTLRIHRYHQYGLRACAVEMHGEGYGVQRELRSRIIFCAPPPGAIRSSDLETWCFPFEAQKDSPSKAAARRQEGFR